MDEKYVKLLDEEHSKSFNKEEKSDIRQKYEEYYE
jgi:hypothetical protein